MFDRIKKGFSSITKKIKIKELTNKDLDPVISELRNLLIRNEVAVDTADDLSSALKEELLNMEHGRFKSSKPMIEEAMRKALYKILSTDEANNIDLFAQIDQAKMEKRPFIILMLGINGTGKTTSIAKLAHLIKSKGYSVILAASDTYRAGAITQLTKHGSNLDIRVIAQEHNSDPAAVAIDAIDSAEANNTNVVLIDTAGRMQNNVNLVRELEKIVRMSEPDLKIFVGDSLAGNDVIRQANDFNNDIGIDGIIMTKLDSDIRGGSVISVAHITKKPVMYVGVGQRYEDLKVFQPEFILNEILS